jgi:glycosyltransferase involved in cell wall biosynthesis
MNAQPSSPSRPGVALVWSSFGHYHVARAAALAARVSLTTIEYAPHSQVNGWHADRAALTQHCTLCDGTVESLSQLRVAARLWKALSRRRPDAVFVPGYASLPALAAALWTRFHRRAGILMTESQERDQPRVRAVELVKSSLIRLLFGAAIAGGKRSVSYLERLGFPSDRIAKYYDVVDNRYFTGQAASLRALLRDPVDTVPPVFLFVGRLAPEKNVSGLLRAFAAYRSNGGQWTLRIVGRGPLEESLRSEAIDLGIADDVLFAGFHERESLVEQYVSAGCFVLPSLREPWGLVVNEAMCCGLPVLASDRCGCAADLVHSGLNGHTFDPANIREMAGLMSVTANRSAAELLAMGRQSLSIISRFTPEAFADEAARLCLAGHSRRHGQ